VTLLAINLEENGRDEDEEEQEQYLMKTWRRILG